MLPVVSQWFQTSNTCQTVSLEDAISQWSLPRLVVENTKHDPAGLSVFCHSFLLVIYTALDLSIWIQLLRR